MKKIILMILLMAGVVLAEGVDTVKVSDVVTVVRRELNDPDSSNALFSNAVLRTFIDQSARDVASAGAIASEDTIITTESTMSYSLHTNCLDVTGVMIKTASGWQSIPYRSQRAFALGDITFGKDAKSGLPQYTVIGQRLKILPTGSGDDSLIVTHTIMATKLNADTTTINIPYKYIRMVVLGSLLRAAIANRDGFSDMIVKLWSEEYGKLYSELKKQSEPK